VSKNSNGHHRQKQKLWRRQNRMCPWCWQPITPAQFRDATRDHIIPKSHGGLGKLPNLQLLHGLCNTEKGDWCPGCEHCAPAAGSGIVGARRGVEQFGSSLGS
jgi:5-methylcytosine-specific restriction endonuclease McrA